MIELKRLTQPSENKFKALCRKDDLDAEAMAITNFSTEKIDDGIDGGAAPKIDKNKKFRNKFKLGEYLYKTLKGQNIDNATWHFLTIVYYKQLLNKNRKIGGIDRFVISRHGGFYPCRHLLKPVYDLYQFYSKEPELIKFLLQNPVNESSGLFLEIVQRQDIMKNRNFIEVSQKIFYNRKKQGLKRGSTKGILRLIDLFKQYERTYDLYSMPSETILNKLIVKHKEFNEYKTGIFRKTF